MGVVEPRVHPDTNNVNSNQQQASEMITEKIGGVTVKRHDDITELVVKNFNLFNEYSLYDAEVGSTFVDIARHFAKLDQFIANNKMAEAMQERKNMNQAFYHVFEGNNFPALQWATLVHSIDDVPQTDLSVDSLKKLIERLSTEGLTQKKVAADVDQVKKKFGHN